MLAIMKLNEKNESGRPICSACRRPHDRVADVRLAYFHPWTAAVEVRFCEPCVALMHAVLTSPAPEFADHAY